MKPIRVLQVLASLDRGGAESMIMSLYRAIDKNKIQFDFVVNNQNKKYAYEEEIEKLGGKVFRVPRYILFNHFSYKNTWKQLLFNHPEWKIIHGHHTTPGFIYLNLAKSLHRISISHSHTTGSDFSFKSKLKILMRNRLNILSDYKFACSTHAAIWMFGSAKETYIINNSIDSIKFSYNEKLRKKCQKALGIENKFVLGHVGRIDRNKNQSFLIDIFKYIHSKDKRSVLLLVGDGPYRSKLEKKVNEIGLKNSVFFTGVRSNIDEFLQAMDVFVFPSFFEGLPVAVVEAQASGLKCFLSDNIDKDIKITDLVVFLSIKDSAEKWANEIFLNAQTYTRNGTQKEIVIAGYDVKENAKWLESFYLTAANASCNS